MHLLHILAINIEEGNKYSAENVSHVAQTSSITYSHRQNIRWDVSYRSGHHVG